MKYYVRTYGCQMNVADSNEMGRQLIDRGLVPTEDPEEASIYLVNSCTVRQHAEDRAFSEIGRLRKWKQRGTDRKIVLTGCAAERTKETLSRRFPYIDLIVGAKSIEEFGPIVDGLLARRETDKSLEYATGASGESSSAFVTIMRGCNYSCTYCIVPYVRGRESYHPIEDVLDDVRARVAEGAKDITLLGQTVNSYQRDGKHGRDTDFADLLEAVGAVDGVDRIRFMSPHPHYMTDRVLEAMVSVPAVCEGLHLPVQSGSNRMLKSMLRNYTRETYLELVAKLRAAMPEIVISTDVIVGFPGETEDDFRRTLSLVEEVGFDWAFVFKYSERQGTPAAEMESHPEPLIEERHAECLELVERKGLERRRHLMGTVQQVLMEDSGSGRTRGNYKVRIEGDLEPGETIDARIVNADRATLDGKLIGQHAPS